MVVLNQQRAHLAPLQTGRTPAWIESWTRPESAAWAGQRPPGKDIAHERPSPPASRLRSERREQRSEVQSPSPKVGGGVGVGANAGQLLSLLASVKYTT